MIAGATEKVDSLCHRYFGPPVEATRYFDWPRRGRDSSWLVDLGKYDLVELLTATSGGTTLDVADLNVEPINEGPPFRRVEIDRGTAASFTSGGTAQRNLAFTGRWSYRDETRPAGALAASIASAVATTITVTDGSLIGVGDAIRIGTEWMDVTGRALVDSTQTGTLTSQANATLLDPSGASSAFAIGEVLLIDGERLLVTDIAGDRLVVERSYDGTPLAAHAGAAIYVSRRLTVARGRYGTTAAAAHALDASITAHVAPHLTRLLTIAESQTELAQQGAKYARMVGQGDTARESWARGLVDIRKQCYYAHARRYRIESV